MPEGYLPQCGNAALTLTLAAGQTLSEGGDPLASAGAISGTVSDSGSMPEPISVSAEPSGGPASAATSVVTDAAGRYVLRNLAPGSYTVCFAELSTSNCYRSPVTVTAGATTSGVDGTVSLPVVEPDLSGTVTDASTGTPVEGVAVSVDGLAGNYQTVTTADGTWSVAAAPGTYAVCFAPDAGYSGGYAAGPSPYGYAPQCDGDVALPGNADVTVASGQVTTGVDAALAERGAVSGTVSDGSGDPLSGVTVYLANPPDDPDVGERSGLDDAVTTDGAGRFLLVGAEPGNQAVCATAVGVAGGTSPTGYLPGCVDGGVIVSPGTTSSGVTLALTAGSSLSGQVTDVAGHDVDGAAVTISAAASGLRVGVVTTAADGTYTEVGLSPGSYDVGFSGGQDATTGVASDFLPASYDGGPGNEPDPVAVPAATAVGGIDETLHQGGTVTGVVEDVTGVPLADATVDIGGHETTTAADGSYTVSRVDGLEGTAVCVSAAPSASAAFGYFPLCKLTGPVEDTTVVADAALQPIGAIRGVVVDQNGMPAAGVEVGSYGNDVDGPPAVVTTDGHGQYLLTGIVPGVQSVCLDPYGVGPSVCSTVDVVGGQAAAAALLHAQTAGPSLAGHVRDASGDPLAEVQVTVSQHGSAPAVVSTEADGSWELYGLTAGTYTVCFHATPQTTGTSTTGYLDQCYDDQPGSSAATPVTVPDGGSVTGLDAVLQPAGSVSGAVTDDAGDGLTDVVVDVYNADGTLATFDETAVDGTYAVEGVPSGTYTVCFLGEDATGGSSTSGYQDSCHGSADGTPKAAPVVVHAGGATTGVDGRLTAG